MYVYIYIYIYIYTTYIDNPVCPDPVRKLRKGTNGVSTNWVTSNVMYSDRGAFWVLPLTYLHLP